MQTPTALAGLLLLAACAAGQDKVVMRFYGEAGCPPCQQLIRGPLNTTLTAEGLWGILDYEYIPWGNAYFVTKECGGTKGAYNATTRECWDAACGGNGTAADDCFEGDLVCQHGGQECYGNIVENCAKNLTGNNPQVYQPFVWCWEGEDELKNSTMKTCAEQSGIDYTALTACASSTMGQALTLQAARKTAALPGGHAGTPWVLINGVELQNTFLMLHTVCADYTGPPPPGCGFARKPSN